MNELEYMDQMQVAAYWNNDMIAYIWIASIVIQLAIHLLTAWGLWKINKKLWEPYAWLSWIPLVNIYSYVRAAGKANIWILWAILATIAIAIPFIWIFIFLFVYISILHAISKRCGRWAWTTVWFLFIPFIMFPIVGSKCSPNKNNTNSENTNEAQTDEKIEL